MATRLEFPDGSVYQVTQPASETRGERFEMELVLGPEAEAPPPHIHPHQHDEYEVLEGSLELRVAGRWQTLAAGGRATVEPGQPHQFRNGSGALVRARSTHRPALSFPVYIERVHALVQSGKLRSPRDPKSLIYISMLFREHADTIAPASLPQRAMMAAMAAVGRLLGLELPPRRS
jgi:quercetin dioxygenase-like cupin family protein